MQLPRKYRDSGYLVLTNDNSLAPNDILVFDVDERFKPYDEVSVTNNSSQDIGVGYNYNNDFRFLVPAGTNRILDVSSKDIRIKNNGTGTINADEIKLNLRHSGEVEKSKVKGFISTAGSLAQMFNIFK